MNLQKIVQRRIRWGAYVVLLLASVQPEVMLADTDSERERLTLYDRNRRNLRWERERMDYFNANCCYRGRGRNYCYRSGCEECQPCGRYCGAAEQPEMAPPE